MTEKFRQQPENSKQHAPEAGAGPLGLPPPNPNHALQSEGSKSPERQPLPSVWEILEQELRLNMLGNDVDGVSNEEYYRQRRALDKLERQLDKTWTSRDNLIFKLFGSITTEPAPAPFYLRPVSIREVRQLRA